MPPHNAPSRKMAAGAGRTYTVEASFDGLQWLPVQTNYATGLLDINLPADAPLRFYRALGY